MGNWKYDGFNREGKRVRGSVEAQTEKEARRLLRGQGVRARKISPPSMMELDLGEWMVNSGLSKPFSQMELCEFTKQLAIMINAGVPIMQSLEILFKQQKNPLLKKALKKIATDVGGGKTLAESMEKLRGFDKLYCNLIKAGEAGGILDTILDKLATFLERREAIKSKIKSAMTYPVVVVLVGAGVVSVLLIYVVPMMAEMIAASGQELPGITKFVMDISDFLQEWAIYLFPGLMMATFVFLRFIKTDIGKPIFDRVAMKTPLFGGIVIKGNLASFAQTLSTMLGAGISLVDSLDICIATVDNIVIGNDLKTVRQAIIEGKTLAEPLERISYFPSMVSQMVKVGEQTGNIDSMLEKVGSVFEQEVSSLIDNMMKLIEPLIIVFLGGAVTVIMIAMYLPVFKAAG